MIVVFQPKQIQNFILFKTVYNQKFTFLIEIKIKLIKINLINRNNQIGKTKFKVFQLGSYSYQNKLKFSWSIVNIPNQT